METLKQAIEARQKEAQRQPDDTLVWLIAGGMLLRALLAVVTEPYAYDQNCFFSWALKIAQDGPGNFYAPDYFADYPPGYMLVLGLVGKLMGLLHLNFTQAAAWLLMSLVPILCAGGLVWAVWNIGLEAGNGDVRWANRAAGFAAFGPSLVYCTGVWMQIDEVVCFLMVLALWRLSRGKFWQGCLWYGAALAVKPQALLAGPVLALCALLPLLQEGAAGLAAALKRGVGGAVCALAPVLAAALPFGLTPAALLEKYLGTAQSYPYASINAFNLMELLGGNWVKQNEAMPLLPITWQQFGTLCLAALTAALCVLAVRAVKAGRFDPLLLAAFYTVGVFALGHRMHERYLLLGLALTLAAAARWRSRWLLGAAAGLSLTSLLNLAVVYSSQGTEDEFLTSGMAVITGRLAGLGAVMFFMMLALAAWDLTRMDEPAPLPETAPEPWAVPAPQPRWTRREALALAGLTLATAVVSLAYLGDTTAPQNGLTAESVPLTETVSVQGQAASVWVYGGITKGGSLTITGADGTTAAQMELKPGACFQWNVLELDVPVTGDCTVMVENGTVFELSFRDEAGEALAVTGSGTLTDEQTAVPKVISQLNSMYFDEIYHGRTGYEQAHGLSIYETTHPPLGKVFIQIGIALFGMTGFGWRISGTVFGILMVPVMYGLCRRLTRRPWLAFAGGALIALDFMRFAQSRIATIDVYGTFFILLGALCMVWYCQTVLEKGVRGALLPMALGGVAFGLGCASKWTGIYSGAGLAVLYFGVLWARYKQQKPGFARELKLAFAGGVAFYVVVPLAIYILSYFPYKVHDPSFRLADWWNCQTFMYRYHSQLKSTHAFESRWYTWPMMLRPVWYYMGKYLPAGMFASIAGFGSPVVWWGGTAALAALGWRQASGRGSRAGAACLVMFSAQILPWMLVTRSTFLYHYFPGAMFGLVALVLWLGQTEERTAKRRAAVLLALALALFVWFYPAISGLPVPRAWAASLKWLPTWGFYIL